MNESKSLTLVGSGFGSLLPKVFIDITKFLGIFFVKSKIH